MRQSTHVRTLVEMALIRICKLEDLDALPAIVAQLRDGVPVGLQPRPVASPPTPGTGTPQRALPTAPLTPPREGAEKKTPEVRPELIGQSVSPPPAFEPTTTTVQFAELAEPPPLDRDSALAAWRQTLAELQDMTGDYGSKFDSVAISGPNRLVVRFRKDYTTAKEFCERPEKRTRLEQTLSRLTGQDIRIDFAVLVEEPQVAVPQQVATRPPVNRRQRQAEMQRHPLVRQAVEMFDAEIVTIVDPVVSEVEVSDQPISPDAGSEAPT